MNDKTKIAYAEVMQVLKYFDRNYVMKIPIELLQYFKENQKKDFIVNIDRDDIFNNNNISREALTILAYLDLEYWCTDEEKTTMKTKYKKNERKHQEEFSKENEYKNIFEKESVFIDHEKKNIEETSIIEYKKENIFKKIKNIILKLLGIK